MVFPDCFNVETFLTHQWCTRQSLIQTVRQIYMASWEPPDIDQADRDEIEKEDDKCDDNLLNELEGKFEELRQLNATLETSSD